MSPNGNLATDYMIDRDLAANDVVAAFNEAVHAKQELIVKTISEGGEVEGHDLETVIESVLSEQQTVLKIALQYSNGFLTTINDDITKEIERIAERIAPDLVNAELEQGGV